MFYQPESQNMFAEDKGSQRNWASTEGELPQLIQPQRTAASCFTGNSLPDMFCKEARSLRNWITVEVEVLLGIPTMQRAQCPRSPAAGNARSRTHHETKCTAKALSLSTSQPSIKYDLIKTADQDFFSKWLLNSLFMHLSERLLTSAGDTGCSLCGSLITGTVFYRPQPLLYKHHQKHIYIAQPSIRMKRHP